MADESKQEEKFDFTAEGEAPGYISLDQARVLAMRTARESPGAYGRRFTDVPMAFEVVEAEETEDHYVITLTFKPEGEFTGTTGREQFFIEKEGVVALRQVLSLPGRAGWRRIPLSVVAIGLVIIVAAAVGGVFATTGGGGNDDSAPQSAAPPTSTLEPPIPTPAPSPTTAVLVIAPTPTPMPAPTSTPTPIPPQSRLLHWWPGDGNANDVVGGSEGVMLNGATFGPGRIGQAFSFPKTRSHLRVMSGTDDFNLEPNEPMTIAMWLKRTEPIPPGQGMQWIGKHRCGDGSSHYVMYIDPNGNLGFLSKGGGNVVAGPNHLPIDQWKHFVATSDGTFWMLYVDGIPEGGPASGDFQSPNNAPLIIGGNAGCTEWFGGLIDEIAIFNYALSAGEIRAIYDGGDLAYLLPLPLGEDPQRHQVSLNAGESIQIVADVHDTDGNRVGSSLIAWQVAPDVGVMDDDGIFTAGTKAGTFSSGIQVNVVHEEGRASAFVDVNVEPSSLASVEIEPSEVVVRQGDTATLTAIALDEYGNPVDGVLFLWEADTGLAVDQTGTVAAGEQGGRYEVSATASYEGSQQTASATVSVPPVWVSLGDMQAELLTDVGLIDGPTAILLHDGKVLVVGSGQTAALYDPETRTFRAAGSHQCNHVHAQSTQLMDGSVLITGGDNTRCAQVYDPQRGTFSKVGEMNTEHSKHTSTLLTDGRVLIAGGQFRRDNDWVTHSAAEIYDPTTKTFSLTSSLNVERKTHTAAITPSGEVLILGGFTESSGVIQCHDSAELYDPNSGKFRFTGGDMPFRACESEASLLSTGEVLITSGGGKALVYRPETETFRVTGNPIVSHGSHADTILPSGQVMVIGGWGPGGSSNRIEAVEIYDPATETFSFTDSLIHARSFHTATLVSDGQVLVMGGNGPNRILASAELWIPSIP